MQYLYNYRIYEAQHTWTLPSTIVCTYIYERPPGLPGKCSNVDWLIEDQARPIVQSMCRSVQYLNLIHSLAQAIPTSSLWSQFWTLNSEWPHSAKEVSFPKRQLMSSSQMGSSLSPLLSSPLEKKPIAPPKPSILQATLAAFMSKKSSQIVPHTPSCCISRRPAVEFLTVSLTRRRLNSWAKGRKREGDKKVKEAPLRQQTVFSVWEKQLFHQYAYIEHHINIQE